MFVNMFWFDRALRAALGSIMLAMAVFGQQSILYVVGSCFFLTGLVGFCPIHFLTSLSEPKKVVARAQLVGSK